MHRFAFNLASAGVIGLIGLVGATASGAAFAQAPPGGDSQFVGESDPKPNDGAKKSDPPPTTGNKDEAPPPPKASAPKASAPKASAPKASAPKTEPPSSAKPEPKPADPQPTAPKTDAPPQGTTKDAQALTDTRDAPSSPTSGPQLGGGKPAPATLKSEGQPAAADASPPLDGDASAEEPAAPRTTPRMTAASGEDDERQNGISKETQEAPAGSETGASEVDAPTEASSAAADDNDPASAGEVSLMAEDPFAVAGYSLIVVGLAGLLPSVLMAGFLSFSFLQLNNALCFGDDGFGCNVSEWAENVTTNPIYDRPRALTSRAAQGEYYNSQLPRLLGLMAGTTLSLVASAGMLAGGGAMWAASGDDEGDDVGEPADGNDTETEAEPDGAKAAEPGTDGDETARADGANAQGEAPADADQDPTMPAADAGQDGASTDETGSASGAESTPKPGLTGGGANGTNAPEASTNEARSDGADGKGADGEAPAASDTDPGGEKNAPGADAPATKTP